MTDIWEVFFMVFLIASAVFGTVKLFKKKEPLYFKMIVSAGWCIVAQILYQYCLYAFVDPEAAVSEYLLTGLGDNAFAAFIFAANYGPMNTLLDHDTKNNKKYRLLSLTAPAVFIGLSAFFCYLCCHAGVGFWGVLLILIITVGFMPVCVYYNLKCLLIPDDGFFVKGIRPLNLCSLLLCFSVLFEMFGTPLENPVISDVGFCCEMFFGGATVLAAVWGRKKWRS